MQNLSFEFIFYTIKTGTIDASFVYTNLPPNNKGSTARFQIYCAHIIATITILRKAKRRTQRRAIRGHEYNIT